MANSPGGLGGLTTGGTTALGAFVVGGVGATLGGVVVAGGRVVGGGGTSAAVSVQVTG